MGGNPHIGMIPEGAFLWQRFGLEHIEYGVARLAPRKTFQQSGFIDQGAAGYVHKYGPGFHRGQKIRVDQMPRAVV